MPTRLWISRCERSTKLAEPSQGRLKRALPRVAEPSLCGLTVGPGDDQGREGEDDNDVADDGGHAWVKGGTFPLPPKRIPTRRVRTPRRARRSANGATS